MHPQCRKRVKIGNSGNPPKANLVEGDDIIVVFVSQANMVIDSKNLVVDRAGNEPSYSGSARKKLGSGRRDPSVAGTRLPPTVSGRQDLVFTSAIPTQAHRSEMPRSCVPDIDVMDPQALDPVYMDGKCVNPHEVIKEALTTKTAGARANPTPSTGGTIPRSPNLLGSGNGTHDSAKVSATVCSSVDSVKKVSAKGTSGKDMDVRYDPLVR